MLLAGCATAAAVLGFHAMKGSTRARLGLSVLAVPIFLGGFATGGFLTSLVAAGTALLWVGPSALWFRGEPVPERAPRAEPRPLPSRPSPPVSSPPPPDARRRGSAAPPEPVTLRPDAVVWACVLTWAFSSLTIVVMAASAVLMATSPDLVFDELARQNADLSGDSALLTEATYLTAAIAGRVVAAGHRPRGPDLPPGALGSARSDRLVGRRRGGVPGRHPHLAAAGRPRLRHPGHGGAAQPPRGAGLVQRDT